MCMSVCAQNEAACSAWERQEQRYVDEIERLKQDVARCVCMHVCVRRSWAMLFVCVDVHVNGDAVRGRKRSRDMWMRS